MTNYTGGGGGGGRTGVTPSPSGTGFVQPAGGSTGTFTAAGTGGTGQAPAGNGGNGGTWGANGTSGTAGTPGSGGGGAGLSGNAIINAAGATFTYVNPGPGIRYA